MTAALIIEDGEALALARDLAERRGTSIDEVVLTALRTALCEDIRARPETQGRPVPPRILEPEEMNPEQRARYDRLRALAKLGGSLKKPGATSDHSDLYDEHGLPI